MNTRWKRLILIWDHASFHVSKMTNDYINAQKQWLTMIYLPKKAPYLNPNERKVNHQIKSHATEICNMAYSSTLFIKYKKIVIRASIQHYQGLARSVL